MHYIAKITRLEDNDIRKLTFKNKPNITELKLFLQREFQNVVDIDGYKIKYRDIEGDYITCKYFFYFFSFNNTTNVKM